MENNVNSEGNFTTTNLDEQLVKLHGCTSTVDDDLGSGLPAV